MFLRHWLIGALSVVLVTVLAVGPAGAGAPGPATPAAATAGVPSAAAGPSSGTTGTSGKRSVELPAPRFTSHSTRAAPNPAGNPAGNITPSPAFPDRCYQAYQSADCTNAVVAALNNARHVMGLPSYALPANFALMPPAYQFLALSNADRVLAGLAPVTAFNPTLNAIAQQAADSSTDPSGPDSVDGIFTTDWTGNWAGGMSPLEAYYDWMYDDGYGSNNLDCRAPSDPGCWGHREDTLWDFGSAEVAMGVGADFTGTSYGASWAALYWAYSPTGARIPRLPAAFAVAAAAGLAAGGTVVTITGYGLESATSVTFGGRAPVPVLSRSAGRLTVRTPAGTGVVTVRVTGDGGTSAATSIATFSYLAAAGAGSFVPLTPARLLDTRIGLGAARSKVPRLATLRLPVSGRGGVPASGVAAVVLDVIVVNPTATGYLTVFGSGAVRPRTSNLDYPKARTVTNLVVAPVGRDGRVAMFNGSGGTLDLVADVSGYYLAGTPTAAGAYVSVAPSRLLDTRIGFGAAKARVSKVGTVRVSVAGRSGIPARGVSAVIVNVTAVDPAVPGYLTVYGDGGSRPTASNLDFESRQTIPNLVLTPVGADGKIAIFNGSAGTVDVLADVVGYVRAGTANTRGSMISVVPSRTFDSRSGVGVGTCPPYDVNPGAGQIFVVGAGYRVPLLITGRHGIPATGVAAVVLNVTVVGPNAPGFYTVYPEGLPIPRASNVDFARGQTVPNLVIVPVPKSGLVNLYNGSSSYNGLIVDVAGYILG